ncbi:MAG: thiolase family protein [Planctomycetota bacterium]
MTSKIRMLPRARIPYGTWGSSYFPAWQTSPLAEVNIGQFAGESMNRILGLRGVPKSELEYLVIGSTIPWHWKFWTAPLVSACMGRRLPGYHVEQACATGLQAVLLAGAEIEAGKDVVGVCTFDRTSDSPVGVFPERRAHERTHALADVWDNFGFDPATGKSMMAAAGMTARKHRIDRREVDDCAFLRYRQYFEAKQSGFLDRVLVPLDVLNVQGKPMGRIDSDVGVKQFTLPALRAMNELDSCVTGGTQTHAADGMATMLVTSKEKAKELSRRPEIEISFVAKAEVRAQPSLMPEAPTLAVQRLLESTGLKLDDIAVLKNHNPFAVNDVVFTKLTGVHWERMNKTGCPLVFGHPQGPTLTRVLMEGLEEAVDLGGGYVLVFGCAAGDVGIAALFQVS